MEQTKNKSLARWVWGALWIAYAISIFYFSSQPIPDAESLFSEIPFGDRGAHFGEYFLFGLLTCLALRPQTRQHWGVTLFFALAYAASDEVHQLFVPTRSASLFDWGADALGIGVSALSYGLLHWKRRGTW